MYKVILSAIDESKYNESVLAATKFFAKSYNSSVLVQYVVNLISLEGSFFHDISGALSMEPMANITKKMKELLKEKGEILLKEFCEELSGEDLECKKYLDIGIVANKIVERGKIADLILIGKQGVNEKFSQNDIGSTAEGVLKKSDTNVLVVTDSFNGFSKPILAYDGTKVSKRAMEGAAYLCEKLNLPLTVVTVTDKNKTQKILDEAEIYLKSFKIDVHYKLLKGSPHSEITSIINNENYDLAFMGTISHHFFIERILGSTATYVLRKTNIPIIFSR